MKRSKTKSFGGRMEMSKNKKLAVGWKGAKVKIWRWYEEEQN